MRTGYTGEDGFEVLCSADEALPIWETILYAGEKLGAMPAGLGARDTLRLEAAFPLYGNELTENRTPFECRLAPFIRLENENFIGRDALLRQKELGVKQRIIGVKMVDRGIPRNGYPVILHGQVIGEVTSGTFAPTLRQPIALAFVDNIQEIRTGAMLGIRIRGNDHHAVVCDLPFYKRRK